MSIKRSRSQERDDCSINKMPDSIESYEHPVLDLQRIIGNRGVQRILERQQPLANKQLIQRTVRVNDSNNEIKYFSVTLRHQPSRKDGYNFLLLFEGEFFNHSPTFLPSSSLEFRQRVRSTHKYYSSSEGGHVHHSTPWHDDGYSRAADSAGYRNDGFSLRDLPGTSDLPLDATNIEFEFFSKQYITTTEGRELIVIEFPTITMQGKNVNSLITTPVDGYKEEYTGVDKLPYDDHSL